MEADMAGKGKGSIFTKFLKTNEARNKAIERAGGGKPGKRIVANPLPRSGKKKG
jgi:hypothetical protein